MRHLLYASTLWLRSPVPAPQADKEGDTLRSHFLYGARRLLDWTDGQALFLAPADEDAFLTGLQTTRER